ncbi:MAG TPA: cytidine deaminase [Lutibacter sp.]|nr:cytidine deaminase [Lutibacter sp.]
MKEINTQTSFVVFDSFSELETEDKALLNKAKEAVANSYAPYSHFHVGAAILLENGIVVTGNNQENAAYPSGMCAERIAIWNASSQYPNTIIKKIAITVKSENKTVDKPVAPCGACRQTLLEYEVNQKEPIEVFFMGEVGTIVKANSLQDLLPFSFDESFL